MGEKLGPADLPSNSSRLIAALVYYLENDTTEPPAPPTAPADIPAVNAAEAEAEALRQRVSELERQSEGVTRPEPVPAPQAEQPNV